jgi:hypothetical protein
MHSSNILLEIPQGTGKLSTGDKVQAVMIGPLIPNSSIPKSLIPTTAKAGCGHHHHSGEAKGAHSAPKKHENSSKGNSESKSEPITVGLIVCSDRAASGEYQDRCIVSFSIPC